MRKQLELLYEIQTIDTNIRSSEELKKKYQTDIKRLEEEFKKSEAQHTVEQNHVNTLEKEQRDREKSITVVREQKKKAEERLMTIKTNKEYQAALQEIETIKASIKEKEDAVIETMDAIEAAKRDLAKFSENLARTKAQFDEKKRQIEVDLKAYLEDIEKQREQRNLLAKEIPPDVFSVYTRLLKVKQGRAVALAEHERCTGCSMQIPPQIYNEVVFGEKIITCPHCNRILCVGQSVAQASEEAR